MPKKNRIAETPAELRKFGFQIGGIFLLLFLFFGYSWLKKDHNQVLMFLSGILGLYLVIGAAIQPLALRGFNRFWSALGDFLGKYIGHYVGMIIFTLLYWIVFSPVALIMLLVRFDPLGIRSFRKVESYWHPRKMALTKDHYEKKYSVEQINHES